MESTQSVHGRITYRRVESVINDKIDSFDYVKQMHPLDKALCDKLQFAIETLQSVLGEIEWRDATRTWPVSR